MKKERNTTASKSNLASTTNLMGVAKNGCSDTTQGFAGKTTLNK